METNENGLIPVRVLNVAEHSIKIKKGQVVIGSCQYVNIAKSLEVEQQTNGQPADKDSRQKLKKSLLGELNYLRAEAMLADFADVFSTGDDDQRKTGLITHQINTQDSTPIRLMYFIV